MAEGLGFIEFSTGDVLSAAAANGYLASQTVMVFASAAARTSAITTPYEGMMSYLKDTNSVEYYSGSAWVAVSGGASGGMTLLSTTTLSGASTTISSISGAYKNLQIVLRSVKPATDAVDVRLQFNSDTGSNYYAVTPDGSGNATTTTYITLMSNIDNAATNTGMYLDLPDYANTNSFKSGFFNGSGTRGTGVNAYFAWSLHYFSTSAISSITLFPSSGNWTSGTVLIYGVN